jgi:chromosome segregation ATPase
VKPEPIRVPIEITFEDRGETINAKLDAILDHVRHLRADAPAHGDDVAFLNERLDAFMRSEKKIAADRNALREYLDAVAELLGFTPDPPGNFHDLVPAIQQLRKRAEAGDLAVMNLEEHHEVHGEERVALINRNRKLVAEVAELQRQLNEARSAAEDVVVGANTVIDHRDDGITRLQRRLEAQKAHIQQQADTITRRNEDLRRVRKRSHNAIVALQADIGRMEEELALRDGQIASLKRSMGHLVAPGMPGPAEER